MQQRGNQNVRVEDDANHCPDGCRSRRAFRAAAISASISSVDSRSNPWSVALSHDACNHSGAEGAVVVRIMISSFSAIERPSKLSIASFWSGDKSLALRVMLTPDASMLNKSSLGRRICVCHVESRTVSSTSLLKAGRGGAHLSRSF